MTSTIKHALCPKVNLFQNLSSAIEKNTTPSLQSNLPLEIAPLSHLRTRVLHSYT
ncbi:hypothetical protein LZ30DRAFT_697027 [Colletotrichum cereale]|nr:hypothetical protein LZ30DRAFT_697027 [Colletotrichum cereale]